MPSVPGAISKSMDSIIGVVSVLFGKMYFEVGV
jgi:hypothetical protein